MILQFHVLSISHAPPRSLLAPESTPRARSMVTDVMPTALATLPTLRCVSRSTTNYGGSSWKLCASAQTWRNLIQQPTGGVWKLKSL